MVASGNQGSISATFDRCTTAKDVVEGQDLSGRNIIITGASSGIGIETARALGSAGANLILGVRDREKGTAVASEIAADITGSLQVEELELCNLESVSKFTRSIQEPIDCLIANAGVSKTQDIHLPNGLDIRFATNHLGHFVLAHLLQPQLAQRGARVVVVSSAAHKGNPVCLGDLQWQRRSFAFGKAYGESKSANILFAQEATRRWRASDITANAVLPGSALTGLQRFHGDELKRQIGFLNQDGSVNDAMKSIGQAAATSVWAVISPSLQGRGGLVLEDCGLAEVSGPSTHPWMGFDKSVADAAIASSLWVHSLDLARELGVELPVQ